jgi:hypothetical protein
MCGHNLGVRNSVARSTILQGLLNYMFFWLNYIMLHCLVDPLSLAWLLVPVRHDEEQLVGEQGQAGLQVVRGIHVVGDRHSSQRLLARWTGGRLVAERRDVLFAKKVGDGVALLVELFVANVAVVGPALQVPPEMVIIREAGVVLGASVHELQLASRQQHACPREIRNDRRLRRGQSAHVETAQALQVLQEYHFVLHVRQRVDLAVLVGVLVGEVVPAFVPDVVEGSAEASEELVACGHGVIGVDSQGDGRPRAGALFTAQ